MKNVVLMGVANLADRLARNRVEIQLGFGGDFASDYYKIRLGISLTRNTAGGVHSQASIQHCIGNCIAHLVGMTFADGLGRENKVLTHVKLGERTLVSY